MYLYIHLCLGTWMHNLLKGAVRNCNDWQEQDSDNYQFEMVFLCSANHIICYIHILLHRL